MSGGYADMTLDTGDPSLPEGQDNESGLRAAFRYDTLDSAFVPRQGNRLTLDLFSPQPTLGAANSYNRLEGNWSGAWSFGNHTLVGRARLGGTLGGDLPYYDEFAVGGLFDLPGYATGELRGRPDRLRRPGLLPSPHHPQAPDRARSLRRASAWRGPTCRTPSRA